MKWTLQKGAPNADRDREGKKQRTLSKFCLHKQNQGDVQWRRCPAMPKKYSSTRLEAGLSLDSAAFTLEPMLHSSDEAVGARRPREAAWLTELLLASRRWSLGVVPLGVRYSDPGDLVNTFNIIEDEIEKKSYQLWKVRLPLCSKSKYFNVHSLAANNNRRFLSPDGLSVIGWRFWASRSQFSIS